VNDKLLYFPYCNIPDSNWTIKSLLYWDNVGIIVPQSFIENPDKHDRFTIDLLQTDLIESIFPYHYTDQVKNFDKGFIDLVNDRKFSLEKRQKDFSKGSYSEIYIQKFGKELLRYLIDLKIAKKKDWETFYIESRTANLIMLYLASVIGKIGDFTPATDDIRNLDLTISQTGTTYKVNNLRQKLLDDLIPFPLNPDLTKLRKFKDKFHEELKSFRILLEQVALDISTTKNKFRQEKYLLQITEILDKKEKILSELNQSKFPKITFGTICGVAAAAYGVSQDNKILALLSLMHSLYSAFEGYNSKGTLTKNYAYLALIDKKFNSDTWYHSRFEMAE
jgi:hypothetical protein